MHALAEHDLFFEYRQIAILSLDGNAVVHRHNVPWAGQVVQTDHIVTGNVLVGEIVPTSMSQAFRRSEAELEEHLMLALEAGRDAGGQPNGQTSAAIVVYENHEFPIVNLRVDVSLEPVRQLCRIFDWFKPLWEWTRSIWERPNARPATFGLIQTCQRHAGRRRSSR